jgi:hypothetical protein
MHRKNLADIRHKLSIIYKHNELMRNELRYQAKIHAISDIARKEKIKFLQLFPHFLFLLKTIKTCYKGKQP